MKIVLFAFKTIDQMQILFKEFGDLGGDCQQVIRVGANQQSFVLHIDATSSAWKKRFTEARDTDEEIRIVCNNGDYLNWFLCYGDENNVDVEVKTVDDEGNIKHSYLDLKSGCLKEWSFGWMLPKEPNDVVTL